MKQTAISLIIILTTLTGCDTRKVANSQKDEINNLDSIETAIHDIITDSVNLRQLVLELKKQDSIIFNSWDIDSSLNPIDYLWLVQNKKMLEAQNEELIVEFEKLRKEIIELENTLDELESNDSSVFHFLINSDSLENNK